MSLIISDVSRGDWSKFVAEHPESNFLQSYAWGKAHENVGHKLVCRGIFMDNALVGGYIGVIKDARRGRYMEIAGGPLLEWSHSEVSSRFLEDIELIGEQANCVSVRVRPQLEDTADNAQLFRDMGFRRAPYHLYAEHTSVVNLEKSNDELLAGMRRQTRYEVRQAAKQGIELRAVTGSEAIDDFIKMQRETARRQGFVVSSGKLLRALVQEFAGDAKIYQAVLGGQVLNMALVLFVGAEVDYFEAASTVEARKFAGAYGLQWQIMQDAKRLGYKRYNLWGTAPDGAVKHRFSGVTTFKRGFGGDDLAYLPAQDLVLRRAMYVKSWLIETARRKKRGL